MTYLNIVDSPQLKGNLSALSGLIKLDSLGLDKCTGITGDISNIAKLTSLRFLSLSYTSVYGNIESIKNIKIKNTHDLFKGNNIGGDISQINTSDYCISFIGRKNKDVSWKTTRSSSEKILSIEGSPNFGSDLDAMLINQANCVKGFSDNSLTYEKTITATGTRTSASDAAVQTLQSKGYTVSITPA